MAVAQAAALSAGLPLYAYLGGSGSVRLPMPMMNVGEALREKARITPSIISTPPVTILMAKLMGAVDWVMAVNYARFS